MGNRVSVVVPCHNEAETLPILMVEMDKLKDRIGGLEVILINDGSSDRTLNMMRACASSRDYVSYYSFSRNFGKEAAMLAGFDHSDGDYVVVMDADLQHNPTLILEMYDLLEAQDELDVVAVKRINRDGESKVRSLFSGMFYKIINKVSDIRIEDSVMDFRMMRRPVVDSIVQLRERNRFSKGLFSWVGFNIHYIEMPNIERVAGTTSWSFWGLWSYAIEGIVNFTDAPLTLATLIGFISMLVAVIYGVYVGIKTVISGDPVAGWPTLIIVVLFLGGIILFCLGIIGKYIAKIFNETKARPHYIIKESKPIK